MSTLTLEKNKVSNYETMSMHEMATVMCEKLKTISGDFGLYSLQVFEATNGDIEASKLNFIVAGHMLHYGPYPTSFVCTQNEYGARKDRDIIWHQNEAYC